MQAYNEAFQALPADKKDTMNGYSPGGVAGRLGITRQAVHNAIKRDKLHAYKLTHNGKMVAIIVPDSEVDHYRRNHLRKTG